MDRFLITALKKLDCSDTEIKLYLASYKHGAATVPELAKAAKIKRSTAYILVSELIEKGLLIEDHRSYGKQIIAVEPKELHRKVTARQRAYGRAALALEDNLTELQALYQATSTRPKVRTFQGFEGLSAIWKDILSARNELLLWTNQETEQQVFTEAHHDQFIAERCRKNLHIRVLVVDNKKGRSLTATDQQYLRTTKVLPKNISFSSETYIYDDKIAMLDHNKAVIGIIIQSEQLATAHRAMFETAWQNAN